MKYDPFLEIIENRNKLQLEEYWGVHVSINNHSICYSQMDLTKETPVVSKQLFLQRSGSVKYFVGYNEITPDYFKPIINTYQELQDVLNRFTNLNICMGGPKSQDYKEVITITECAQIDHSTLTWRHRNCSYFTTSGLKCKYCATLPKRFWDNLNRNKKKKTLQLQF